MATKNHQLELLKKDYIAVCEVVDRTDLRVEELRAELLQLGTIARVFAEEKDRLGRRLKEMVNP